MKKFGVLMWLLLILTGISPLRAQGPVKISGTVTGPLKNNPVIGAVLTVSGSTESATTDRNGHFEILAPSAKDIIEIWAPGYYSAEKPVSGGEMNFILVPDDKFNYNEDLLSPFVKGIKNARATTAFNLNKSNFAKGGLLIDDILHSSIPGLHLIKGSGMPGEGSFINARGLNSLIGWCSPLYVIDGAPYLPDMSESPVIGGYSGNIFNGFSASDIKNISFLEGAEAAVYGSLGSNGVIMIETDDATDLETRISFYGQYGVADIATSMPVLGTSDYKTYLGSVALTRFGDMGDIMTEFPFLKDDPDYYYNFLYNQNTGWQDEIMNPAFVTENILKIKGGDAIAKYDLSFGYLNQGGVVVNSGLSRYNMRLKSNINVSRKIELFASMSLSYITNYLHEQGIIPETNPILAAIAKSPLLSPYKKDEYNNILPEYASIRDADGNIRISDAVSNPLALVNTTRILNEGSDVIMNMGLNYALNDHLKFTGIVGLYSNYNHSGLFIPGISSGAIMPLEDGLANNTVRDGIKETFNMYYNLNANFSKVYNNVHRLQIIAGFQALTTRKEFDAGQGRNTSSDFYKTLDNVNSIGRSFYGYIDKWNWMNGFARADYTIRNLVSAGLSLSVDGASPTGSEASQAGVFPGVNIAAYLHNLQAFRNVTFINRLVARGEFVKTGNSYFGSNISDYYYRNQVFRQLSGIVRANIPNPELKWEDNRTINIGVDLSGFRHRVDVNLDWYDRLSTDVIIPKDISSVYGIDFIYDNKAEIRNMGIEAAIQAYLVNMRNFSFIMGGSVAGNKNRVTSLGGEPDRIIEFEDGSAMVTREGEAVYSFFGYKTNGVYASSEEAIASGITDYAGNAFNAGDMRFVNVNAQDQQIDAGDRIILGNPNPDFFGYFYSLVQFRQISLLTRFSYCYGNEVYNALRKEFETMDNFGNQLTSTKRRWQYEGQVTDMPRAVYGDPMKNGRFSDRWIEDGSFLRLKELTLSYDLKKGDLGFLQGGTIYITGENLLTFTGYLGYDPEFSYSSLPYKQGIDFGKVPVARTVKLGFKLQF